MVVDRSAAEQRRAGCSGTGRFPDSGLQARSGYTWGWLVHSLFPQPAFRGHDPFAEELPSRRRLGSAAVGPSDFEPTGQDAVPSEPLFDCAGAGPATGFVLVLGTRARSGERVLGQVLP